jgi:prepilin-type N-terminal cleavage/methylation domain-containing protein
MRYGFTLVELLVVIAATVLLVTLFMSCVPSYRGNGHRTTCKANIKGIAEACAAYMSNPAMHRKSKLGNAMPTVTPAPSRSNWSSADSGNPSALWLLVKYKFIGRESFLCPSAEFSRGFRTPTTKEFRFADNTLSYSYMSQVKFTDASTNTEIEVTSNFSIGLKPSELAIIADANPRSRVGRQDLDNDQRGRNSLNHDQEGQNVGFLGGNADWFSTTTIPGTRPLTDSDALDDIYQSCGSDAEDAAGRRGALNDAFLIP